ncbi:Hsp20/alpha crystallin family protein [Patescibacteria group bacterium]|nr:Hsp20/alpha crystallin family protein [Patescibacteria group bacterium]MBU1246743.1 Hsp20/alpha crystallin family protein [Patescibacteria group bacterium]MBU1519640.1 Hsp20/alpha crystallin family protein [Patescibacteria group bacterium]MBU1730338.1 Hsp20/alpha crystallin family protein [Patescibacteria group bacterium]MBU1956200.1 Hsp20/alpha crystallin family protein [Patescibacteria group bacterium]
MYKKDKRSFFEKLTGVVNIQEDDDFNNKEVFLNDSSNTDEENEVIQEQDIIIVSDETDSIENEDREEGIEKNVEEENEENIEEEIEEDTEEDLQENTQVTPQQINETEGQEGELAVDVYEDENEILVQTMVAGVAPEDMEIIITREMITLKGRRDSAYVPQENYYHKELYWGGFSRKILLPEEIDPEKSEAIEKHGLLILRLPKLRKSKTQKLKIQVL